MAWAAIIPAAISAISSMSAADKQASAARESGQMSAEAANPYLDWQKGNIIPAIDSILGKGQIGEEELKKMLKEQYPQLLEQFGGLASQQEPARRLRDIGINTLSDAIDSPMKDKQYADSEKYAALMDNMIRDPNQFYMNSPQAAASLRSGQQMLERTAAAKGRLGSGGFMADLQKLGQDNFAGGYSQQLKTLSDLSNQRRSQYQLDMTNSRDALIAGMSAMKSPTEDLSTRLKTLSDMSTIPMNSNKLTNDRLGVLTQMLGLGSNASASQALLAGGMASTGALGGGISGATSAILKGLDNYNTQSNNQNTELNNLFNGYQKGPSDGAGGNTWFQNNQPTPSGGDSGVSGMTSYNF